MELFQLLGTIAIDNSKANSELDQTTGKAESSSSKIKSAFKKIGAAIITAFAVQKIVAFGKACVEAYNVQEAAEVKLATIMKQRMKATDSQIQSIKNYASALQKVGVVGDEVALSGAQQLATFLNTDKSLKTLIPAMENLAVQQNGVNVSAESMTNIGNLMGKVMQGQTSALKRVGITFTEAQEKVLKYGTEEERAAMLAQVITDNVGEMNTVMAKTDAGKIQQVKNSFGDLQEIIGSKLIPLMANFASKVNFLVSNLSELFQGKMSFSEFGKKMVDQIQSSITNGLPKLMQSGGQILEKIGDGLKTGIPAFVSNALDIIVNFTKTFRENAPQLIKSGCDMILKLAQGLMDSLPSLIEKLPIIVSNIANTISDNAPTLLTTALKLILTLGEGLIKAIPTLIASIPQIIKAIVDVFIAYNWVNLGKNIVVFLKNGLVGAIQFVITAANNIKTAIINIILTLPAKMLSMGKSAITKLASGIKSVLSNVKSAVKSIFNGIVNGFTSLPSKLATVGRNLIKGLWNGISDMAGWIKSKIQGFGSGVLNALKSFFGIHSPSKVMEQVIGKNLALGVAEGIDGNTSKAIESAEEMGSLVTEAAQSSLDNVQANMTMASEFAQPKAYSYTPVSSSQYQNDNGENDMLSKIIELLEKLLGKDTSVYLNSKEISKQVNKDLGVVF